MEDLAKVAPGRPIPEKWKLFFKFFCYIKPQNVPSDSIESVFLFEQVSTHCVSTHKIPVVGVCVCVCVCVCWNGAVTLPSLHSFSPILTLPYCLRHSLFILLHSPLSFPPSLPLSLPPSFPLSLPPPFPVSLSPSLPQFCDDVVMGRFPVSQEKLLKLAAL